MMFENKVPVRVLMVPCYQYDVDYDRCACGRRKLRSERLCGACRGVVMSWRKRDCRRGHGCEG